MGYTKTIVKDHRLPRTFNGTLYNYGPFRTSTKSGSSVPGWRKLIASQRAATSDYSVVQYSYGKLTPAVSNMDLWARANPSIRHKKSFNGYIGNNRVFSTIASSPEQDALKLLYEKLRMTRSQMNGLQFFGELRETIHMMRHPANSLIKGVSQWADNTTRLIKKNPSLLASKNRQVLVNTVSGTWLEAVFGWQPFISDVKSLAETAGRLVVDNQIRQDRVVAQKTNTAAGNYTTGYFNDEAVPDSDPFVSRFYWRQWFETENSARYEAFLSSRLTGPTTAFEKVAQVSGLTFENVVPTLWELTPYSFLVDYFANVGDCLNASFTDVSNVNHSLKTLRIRDKTIVQTTFDPTYYVYPGSYFTGKHTGQGGYVEEIRTTLTRTKLTSLPKLDLTFTLMNSEKKWWNTLAVLDQTLKRLRF